MNDNPDLAKAVSLAISDPGAVLPRKVAHPADWDGLPTYEQKAAWQARAVLEAVRPWLAGPTPEQMVREFNAGAEQAGHGYSDTELALQLVGEEVQELHDAIAAEDPVAIADAAADVVYNAVGIAVARGIPFDEVLQAVHLSNMTKLIPPIVRRGDGKIVKGPHFKPPEIARALGLDEENADA